MGHRARISSHNTLIASPLMEPFSGVRNRVSRLGHRYYYRTQRTEGGALKCGMFRTNFARRKSELPSIIGALVIKQKRDGKPRNRNPPVDLNLGFDGVVVCAGVGVRCLKELCQVRLAAGGGIEVSCRWRQVNHDSLHTCTHSCFASNTPTNIHQTKTTKTPQNPSAATQLSCITCHCEKA